MDAYHHSTFSSPMADVYQDMPETPLYPMSPTFESGSSSNDSRQYVCLAPNCEHVPFKRVTDLDRHYKSVHIRDEDKEKFFCDYKKCPRNQDPFYRPERLRNHLRDYHKEDLPKKGTKSSAEWLKERNVQSKWWRCYSCLKRVEIRREGFTCPDCHQVCEPDRQSLRERKR